MESPLEREMFSIVFKQVSESTFMHDQQALNNSYYKVLGQLVALSLLKCGTRPHFFCPILANYIVSKE